jgi:hypothetical protein
MAEGPGRRTRNDFDTARLLLHDSITSTPSAWWATRAADMSGRSMRTSSTRACSCCRRRQYRFPHRGRHGIGRTFFTGVDPREVIANLDRDEEGFVLHDAWQDIQAQLAPVTPEGYGGSSNVEELQSQARIRGQHAQAIVEDTFRLLADDFLNGARWLDVRKTQDRMRDFGRAPTAA